MTIVPLVETIYFLSVIYSSIMTLSMCGKDTVSFLDANLVMKMMNMLNVTYIIGKSIEFWFSEGIGVFP